jgi:hypothetical protein
MSFFASIIDLARKNTMSPDHENHLERLHPKPINGRVDYISIHPDPEAEPVKTNKIPPPIPGNGRKEEDSSLFQDKKPYTPTIDEYFRAVRGDYDLAEPFMGAYYEEEAIEAHILDAGSNATGSLPSIRAPSLHSQRGGSKESIFDLVQSSPTSLRDANRSVFDLVQTRPPSVRSSVRSEIDLTQSRPAFLRRPSNAATDVSSLARESRTDLFRAQTSTDDPIVGAKKSKKSPFSSNAPSINLSLVDRWESGSNATGSPSSSLRGAPTHSQSVTPNRSVTNLPQIVPPSLCSLRVTPTAQDSRRDLSLAHSPSPSKTGANTSKMWEGLKGAVKHWRESRGATRTAGSEQGTGRWGGSIFGRGDRRGEGISGNVSRSEGVGGWNRKSMRKWGKASEGD